MPSASPTDPGRGHRRGRGRARAIIGVALALGGASGCVRTPGAPVRVTIPPGASVRVAADSLSRAGIIRWPRLFRAYVSLSGHDRRVRAGTYLLRPGSSWRAVRDALTLGRGIVHTATFPEGIDLARLVPVLARTVGAPVDSVWAAVSDPELLRRLAVPTTTAEGYLFPDTYGFADGTTARRAVQLMVERFERAWSPAWSARAAQLGRSRHEIVTMASIVEREAKLPEERPVIAAVYYNRLKAGMRLQADPTVQYALGYHVPRVLFRDLAVESRYNTYRYAGLPPGPIGAPGTASLLAALYPAAVPFLYFVAHPDGHHEFRSTLAEHTQAARAIRRDTARVSPAPRAPQDTGNDPRAAGAGGSPRRDARRRHR